MSASVSTELVSLIGKPVQIEKSGEIHKGILGLGQAIFGMPDGAERALLLTSANSDFEFASSEWKVTPL